MSQLVELVREVNKIITAPYAVALKNLFTLVSKIDGAIFQEWADVKQCQLIPLATILLSSLDTERHTVAILNKFLHATSFREALLVRRPSLLAELLQRLTTSGDDDPRLAKASPIRLTCFALLSSPRCTSELSAPSLLPAFINIALSDVVSEQHGAPLYNACSLILTLSARILELADESVLTAFVQVCRNIVVSATDATDSLSCMAINASVFRQYIPMTSSTIEAGFISSESLLAQWAFKVSRFFSGSKAGSNLQVTVLRVIDSCSAQLKTGEQQATKNIDLARFIIDTIKMSGSDLQLPAAIIAKLCEKTCLKELPPRMKFSIMAMCTQIIPELGQNGSLESAVCPALDALTSTHADTRLSAEDDALTKATAILETIEKLDLKILKTAAERVIDFVLSQCEPEQTKGLESHNGRRNALMITQALYACLSRLPRLRSTIISTMISIPAWWLIDARIEDAAEKSCAATRHGVVCPKTLEQTRLELCALFSKILLQVTCTGSESLAHESFSILIKRISSAKHAMTPLRCEYLEQFPLQNTISNVKCMPQVDSRIWEQILDQVLAVINARERATIVDYISEVCQDLELRCENIEQPLREAKDRVTQLEHEQNHHKEKARTSAETADILNHKLACLRDQHDELDAFLQQTVKALRDRDCEIAAINAKAKKDAEKLEAVYTVQIVSLKGQLLKESGIASKSLADVQWLIEENETNRKRMQHELESRLSKWQETHAAEMAQLQSSHEAEVQQMLHEHDKSLLRLRTEHKQQIDEITNGHETILEGLRDQQAIIISRHDAREEENIHLKELLKSREEQIVRSERSWKAEKEQLLQQLGSARKRERRVLAAIQGNSPASPTPRKKTSPESSQDEPEIRSILEDI